MNNNTKNSENKINLGRVKIFESADGYTDLELNVPIRIRIHVNPDLDKYERISIDSLIEFSRTIFEHISRLALIADNEGWNGGDLHGILDLLGLLGMGLSELQQSVPTQFEKYRNNQTSAEPEFENQQFIPQEQIIDVSETSPPYLKATPITEKKIKNFLNNPNTADAAEVFAKAVTTIKDRNPLYYALARHYSDEMFKAVNHGRICTPERMALLYPIFREINLETDEIKAEEARDERLVQEEEENLETLAKQISDIMHNPLLPEKIHTFIDEQLSTISGNIHTPENVLYNLEQLRSKK